MKHKVHLGILFLSIIALSSCESFVEIDAPKTQIVRSKVFENDNGARSTISGILAQMTDNGMFASGSYGSVTVIGGLSSDELLDQSSSQTQVTLFNNALTPINNSTVNGNWDAIYSIIYAANSALEGSQSSAMLSDEVRDQVIGEAKFLRAFSHFYLVNLFGDVPLITTTDYRVNRAAARTSMSEVYKQIESDLLDAQRLLLDDYSLSDGEKTEPNKWAATALLARTYLYEKKWAESEAQASAIIESGEFSLATDLNSVFLANSEEAIWQLINVSPSYNTNEAPFMVIISASADVSLSPAVVSAFESGDARLNAWVGTYTDDDGSEYKYAYKYKVNFPDEPITEYYMVFRLAEQYLIRAEARAMQGNLIGAINDLNSIRVRANLSSVIPTGLSQAQILNAISQERRVELFVEWGHRWFDLKRSGSIDAVLGPVKPDWQSKDALFPIPQSEIIANPNLTQNPQ
ncbi:MAG TPA: RagB/SusD family nutrient uptake outer membrane protein [Cyclobacteriaceae bacterium]|nr:RagB/SusD family nutrient uptake outer membrane protein [Cyclobacteriaceae bacterium]